MAAKVTRTGQMIVLGDDEVRIEEGEALKQATATAELLSDAQTAPHYYEGVRERTVTGLNGKAITFNAQGVDAKGKPIVVGEEMHYLDYGGTDNPGERCFYVFRKVPVDPTKPTLANGDPNPHYVPDHVRAGALLEEGTPANRTHYEFIFEQVGTAGNEDDAIALGQRVLAGKE
jgi:hypothetical protein